MNDDARIGGSSLGSSAARRIRSQTTPGQVAAILRRRDELAAAAKQRTPDEPDGYALPGQADSRPDTSASVTGASRTSPRSTILITGGDGFCGWPTSLYLSERGFDVTILDNLSRRAIDVELGTCSLTPIRPISERLAVWREVSGRKIGFVNLDLATEYERFVAVVEALQPDSIVHFAAQRAAPYSMQSDRTRRYTVDNNLRATHNLLSALAATGLDSAVVHLGSMGVYGHEGWASTPVPEGYLTVKIPTPDGDLIREILHPAHPGSVYHMTKALDELMFAFYAQNDRLRITDLHQGIVWGTETDQTSRDERLINRFDYDGEYGTVLNRFLMQGAIGHPLTVYGAGRQTRAFIHIRDTVRCIEIAIGYPPEAGTRPRVLNQVTETHRIEDLAKIISGLMGSEIAYLPNPRQETDDNDLLVSNDQFLALGLNPTRMSDGLLEEIKQTAQRYRHRADSAKIISRSVWRKGMETAENLKADPHIL
jgi:UDP-sulfoquinovose synthase